MWLLCQVCSHLERHCQRCGGLVTTCQSWSNQLCWSIMWPISGEGRKIFWHDDGIYLPHSRSKEHQQQGYFIPTLRSTRWTQHTMVLIFRWRMIRNTISSTSSTISELWSLTEAPSQSSWDMRGKYWNFFSLNQELFQLSQPGARKKQRRTSEDVWIGIRESEIHCSPVWGGWSQCWKESGAGYEQLQWHHHHKKVCLHFSENS